MTNKHIKYIAIFCLALASLMYGLISQPSPEGKKREDRPAGNLVRVERVSDGDTVRLLIAGRDEKVRLIGIDAPELGQRPWGKRSKDHLREIISGSSWSVSLELDIVERDKYGRLLGYLRTPDGTLINEMMVRDGYAVLYTFPPNVKYVDLLTKAQTDARSKQLGIWGRNGLRQEPSEYRRQHPRH